MIYTQDDRISELEKKLKEKNYKLISTNYIGSDKKYTYTCGKHTSSALYHNILKGITCPKCIIENQNITEYKDLLRLCQNNNFSLISPDYLGAGFAYKIQCDICGHKTNKRIKNHIHCRECHRIKSFKMYQEKIHQAGYVFSSSSFKTVNERYLINCKKCGKRRKVLGSTKISVCEIKSYLILKIHSL